MNARELIKAELLNTEQYKCNKCSNIWWEKNAKKCIKCKKFNVRRLDHKEMFGDGFFECSSCKRRWIGKCKGDATSNCNECEKENFPILFVPPSIRYKMLILVNQKRVNKTYFKSTHQCSSCIGDFCPVFHKVESISVRNSFVEDSIPFLREFQNSNENFSFKKIVEYKIETLDVYIKGVKSGKSNFASFGIYWSENNPRNISEILTEGNQNNYRASLQAAIKAVKQAIELKTALLNIFTDFDYLKKVIDKSIDSKANLQDIEILYGLFFELKNVICIKVDKQKFEIREAEKLANKAFEQKIDNETKNESSIVNKKRVLKQENDENEEELIEESKPKRQCLENVEKIKIEKEIEIKFYVKGVKSGKSNFGLGVYCAENNDLNISEKLTEEYQTEYKAYLQATIKAIRKAIERNAVTITIYTDFDYLKSCIDKSIKKPKKNLQELKELDNLYSQIKVFCILVDKQNFEIKEADRLANDAACSCLF